MKRMLKKQRKLEQQQQSTQSKNVLQKIWIWIKAVLHFVILERTLFFCQSHYFHPKCLENKEIRYVSIRLKRKTGCKEYKS